MDGALCPHKPPYPIQSKRPPPPQSANQLFKFSSSTLHLPPPSPPSFPLDSLLHHLVHLSSTPRHANSATRFPSLEVSTESTHKWRQELKSVKPVSSSLLGIEIGGEEGKFGDGSLKLLCKKEVVLLKSIVEHPLTRLSSFFDSAKSELLRTDLVSLVKALDVSGHWERAVFLFEWLDLPWNSRALKLDHQVIEILVRILGRESQYSVVLDQAHYQKLHNKRPCPNHNRQETKRFHHVTKPCRPSPPEKQNNKQSFTTDFRLCNLKAQ